MISFSYGWLSDDETYRWAALVDCLKDNNPDYDVHQSYIEDINHMRRLGPKYGFHLRDRTIYQMVCLDFDDPQHEMMFKLKYL